MAIYSKESLENLRQKIDLVDVLKAHIDLKKMGSSYKAICPFHDEKSPSFVVQRGDMHYHCFGCGAHGDAVQFLMTYLKMSFTDSIEALASKFQVHLEKIDTQEQKGPNKAVLKEAMMWASQFYQFCLLHTEEGHAALHYLFKRGVTLDFIRQFEIGLAPVQPGSIRRVLSSKNIKEDILVACGLISETDSKRSRDFFLDRIIFPIKDPTGAVIGFSGRKYKESTFGGKYVNSPETLLFKKSKILFGLNYCRRRIAKERQAIIVEGQLDALRLIYAGFNLTVAGQGTAFGENHAKELINLGVDQVFLALDSDSAGREATKKIGDFFQKEGVEVFVLNLPEGQDPDLFIREYGADKFNDLIESSEDYLTFLVRKYGQEINLKSPAGKNKMVQELAAQIRSWNQPVLERESLKKLAFLAEVPEDVVGVGREYISNVLLKKSGSVGIQVVDPDKILETDLLRWLIISGHSDPSIIKLARDQISLDSFYNEACRTIYQTFCRSIEEDKPLDLISLMQTSNATDDQIYIDIQTIMKEIHERKINKEKSVEGIKETIQRILERNWLKSREMIVKQLQSGQCSEEEILSLTKKFDSINKNFQS